MRAHYRSTLAGLLPGPFLQPLAGATAAVYQEGTSTLITETIYSGPTGAGTLANPMAASATGVVEFWLERAKRVDLNVTYAGLAPLTVTVDVGELKLAEFDVEDYGALGGGVDDTVAIQAAFDAADVAGGGTVVSNLPTHKITSTIVAGSGPFKTINLKGQGMLATRLQWYGATDQPVIRVNGLKQYIFEGFLVENKVAVGSTVGIRVKRDSGTGTQSGGCAWRNVGCNGFFRGVHIGDAAGLQAASEFLFDNLHLQSNAVGCLIEQSNSLNFVFNMLVMGFSSDCGLRVTSGGVVSVNGGSASFNNTDFDFQPASSYKVDGFRSESADRFLIGGNTSAGTPINVSNCVVKNILNADGYGIRVGSGPINLRGNTFLCKVSLKGNADSSSVLIGNAIMASIPADFSVQGGTGGHYSFVGNRQIDASGVDLGALADEIGYVSAGVRVPSWNILTNGAMQVRAFTTATRPTAASSPGAVIYVSDGAGGSKFQGSDGSSWVSLG